MTLTLNATHFNTFLQDRIPNQVPPKKEVTGSLSIFTTIAYTKSIYVILSVARDKRVITLCICNEFPEL